jgi:8-oxo-dGTP pyrophosphatase MutT (NUDIX family)
MSIFWDIGNIVFPGGQCDEGESDLMACKRELFEEIGLKV